MKNIIDYLDSLNLKEESAIVIGVSGGADSMVLLDILENYLRGCKCNIVVAHVDHDLREESRSELEFVKDYVISHNLTFESIKLTYENKFTEEIGRKKRYDFFYKLMDTYKAKYLFTAHHGDDLIETILMRITRGSSLIGYTGIRLHSIKKNHHIIRPLLYLNKKDIYDYVDKNNIPYVEDKTNFTDEHTRNRYRMNILPFLYEEQDNAHLKYLNYSEKLLSCLDYVAKEVQMKYNYIVVDRKIDVNQFKELDIFIRNSILEHFLYAEYGDDITSVADKHLMIINKFIDDGINHSSIDLPLNRRLVKNDNKLYFENFEKEEYSIILEDKVTLPNGKVIERIDNCDIKSNDILYLDSKEIEFPLIVRTYKTGDKMQVKNMQGTKKVGDIFTNSHISNLERTNWPILVDNKGNILWIPSVKKSQFDKHAEGKYDIILKYY